MSEPFFYQHLQQYLSLDAATFSEVLRYFTVVEAERKAILQHIGSPAQRLYFVSTGCMHLSLIDARGNEKTVQFAMEGWWLADFLAFRTQQVSAFQIQTIEPCRLLTITHAQQEALLAAHPAMERYFRSIYEIGYGAALRRIGLIFQHSKEEMYQQFRDQFPDFLNRVPQYLIASFLGLTPEYLSKLRGREANSDRS